MANISMYQNSVSYLMVQDMLLFFNKEDNRVNEKFNILSKLLRVTQSQTATLETLSSFIDEGTEVDIYNNMPYDGYTGITKVSEFTKMLSVEVELFFPSGSEDVYIQTKQSSTKLTKDQLYKLIVHPLTTIILKNSGQSMVNISDKKYREGNYKQLTVPIYELLKLNIHYEEIRDLITNSKDYRYTVLEIPEPLKEVISYYSNDVYVVSSKEDLREWVPLTELNAAFHSDMDDITSNYVRKFIHELRIEAAKVNLDINNIEYTDMSSLVKFIYAYVNRVYAYSPVNKALDKYFPYLSKLRDGYKVNFIRVLIYSKNRSVRFRPNVKNDNPYKDDLVSLTNILNDYIKNTNK